MKTNVFKFISENPPPKTKRLKSDVSNSYRYNLKVCNALIVKRKKHWLYRSRIGEGAPQIHFHISTVAALEKSDHSESDTKLIRAHWLGWGILVVIHPNLQTL